MSLVSSNPNQVTVGPRTPYGFGEAQGYFYEERGEAYSLKEDVHLLLPPRVEENDAILQGISNTYLSCLAVRAVSGQYESPRHRVVCSDLLIRRALPCHLGVFMRYDGGSRSAVVREDIKAFVKREIATTGEVSASDIIALAHKRGLGVWHPTF